MLRDENNALRYLAYELINKRQLDFENVDAAIDRAFTRQANAAVTKVVPKRAAVVVSIFLRLKTLPLLCRSSLTSCALLMATSCGRRRRG